MDFEFFHFKDFSMRQSKSGQRINTDSVVFADQVLAEIKTPTASMMDIGAGTGVLSLMIANKIPSARITAIEPDEDAFLALAHNCADRLWEGRITPLKSKLQDFASLDLFDFIVCNPPFFSDGPRSQEQSRALARHGDSLEPSDVAKHTSKLLKKDGFLYILSSADTFERWTSTMTSAGLKLHLLTKLADSPINKPHAAILGFSLLETPGAPSSSQINYRQSKGGDYSSEMTRIRSRWLSVGAK